MFTIGNVARNNAWNRSGVSVDGTSPLYKELVAKYHYMRDPLLPMADDVEFQDFIRKKVMEKATSARNSTIVTGTAKCESDPAPGSKVSNHSSVSEVRGVSGASDAIVPQKSTQERNWMSRRPFKKYFRFFCM